MNTENESWRRDADENQGSAQGGYKNYNRENRFNGYGGGNRSNRTGGYRANGNGYGASDGVRRPRFSANDNQGERRQRFARVEVAGSGESRPYRAGNYRNSTGYGGNNERNRYNAEGEERNRSFNGGGYNNNYNNYNGNRPQRRGFNVGNGRPQQGGPRRRTEGYNPNAKYSHKKQIEYKEILADPNAPVRLNKYLANAGLCSRREADEFITAGVVSVNGVVVTELGTKILPTDVVKFHDETVSSERKVYILLNKPKDCVTTSDDPQERKTVMDLVKGACSERIYPVGRLDRNTTGVLLLTNDGDLASKLTHPKYLKKKIYHVYCDKNVTKADLDQIASGIMLEDGEIHADAISYASDTDKSQVGIEIHSGKNRIVRRIFESLGYRVTKLDRVFFAGLTKKNLRRGDWRFLTEKEVNMLRMGAFQ
ncbi:MAG: rRNA pseudouridine synthase [Bacteroidaceae bacterium]|nr:rRNA pseudouridine synthase [Bacteroidaceae bacterium]